MEQLNIQTIHTGGITYISPLTGSGEWYWGTDYTSGDLYEAEELFLLGRPIRSNRLIFVHGPTGRVVEPVPPREGQYFGLPIWDHGAPVILLADFPAGEIRLLRYDDSRAAVETLVTLPRAAVKDCYNLMPHQAPLMLTRQAENRFQIVWPEQADFPIAPQESFCCRRGQELYFSRWYEDPDYRVEVVVRALGSGEILGQFPGDVCLTPDGTAWVLVG